MSFDVILAGIDGSPRGSITFAAATGIAETLGAGEIHLITVLDAVFPWATDRSINIQTVTEGLRRRLESEASAELERLEAPPGTKARVLREVRMGVPAEALVARAEELKAAMLVVASRDFKGIVRAILGSVAHTLIRCSPVPVLVVGEDRPWQRPTRVIVGVDLSATSRAALDEAVAIARGAGATLEVISCFERPWRLRDADAPSPVTPEEEAAMIAAHRWEVSAAMARAGVQDTARLEILTDQAPAAALIAAAGRGGPALVVLGVSGTNAWQRLFLGSTAKRVLEAAPCPIVVVPAARPAS